MFDKKILIIEDEKVIQNFLSLSLKSKKYEPIIAENGLLGISLFMSHNPDLILLDLGLPDIDGTEVLKQIRSSSDIPIIIISARGQEREKVNALDLGADDYITKPFNLKILTLKIKKLLKMEGNNSYRFENLLFDCKKGELNINGEVAELTRREIQFLEFMFKNKGLIFSREKLLNEVWGFDFEGDDRVVDTLVRRIRKKLGDYSYLLKTVRGMGYQLDENKN